MLLKILNCLKNSCRIKVIWWLINKKGYKIKVKSQENRTILRLLIFLK